MLSVEKWDQLLKKLEFAQTEFLVAENNDEADQSIVISTKVAEAIAAPTTVKEQNVQAIEPQAAAQPSNGSDDVTATIVRVLAETLELEPGAIKIDQPYVDYGIDSILAVDGGNHINKELDIKLRTTDFFNYVNVKDLSQYISVKFADSLLKHTVAEVESKAPKAVVTPTEQSNDDKLMEVQKELEPGTKSVEQVDELINLLYLVTH